MKVRRARFNDALFVYMLSQESSVRAASVRSDRFTFEQHMEWWSRRFYGAQVFYIIEDHTLTHGDQPVGYVRYGRCGAGECDHWKEEGGPFAEIAIAVLPSARHRGLAVRALRETMITARRALNAGHLIALILEVNEASKKTFWKAGFKSIDVEERMGKILLRYQR